MEGARSARSDTVGRGEENARRSSKIWLSVGDLDSRAIPVTNDPSPWIAEPFFQRSVKSTWLVRA